LAGLGQRLGQNGVAENNNFAFTREGCNALKDECDDPDKSQNSAHHSDWKSFQTSLDIIQALDCGTHKLVDFKSRLPSDSISKTENSQVLKLIDAMLNHCLCAPPADVKDKMIEAPCKACRAVVAGGKHSFSTDTTAVSKSCAILPSPEHKHRPAKKHAIGFL
jgi:hypothetical protein